MKVEETSLPGVLLITPRVFSDERGFFLETYQHNKYRKHGIQPTFVQDNLSFSRRGTLRGLHYQLQQPQAKLVQAITGSIFDVAVDIRQGSPTFGCWVGVELSAENRKQLFIPEGFAHGFCVTSDTAYFSYKCSDFFAPKGEGGILYSDPDIGIDWPLDSFQLSQKDKESAALKDTPHNLLPHYRS